MFFERCSVWHASCFICKLYFPHNFDLSRSVLQSASWVARVCINGYNVSELHDTKRVNIAKDDSRKHRYRIEGIGYVGVIMWCDRVIQLYIRFEKSTLIKWWRKCTTSVEATSYRTNDHFLSLTTKCIKCLYKFPIKKKFDYKNINEYCV